MPDNKDFMDELFSENEKAAQKLDENKKKAETLFEQAVLGDSFVETIRPDDRTVAEKEVTAPSAETPPVSKDGNRNAQGGYAPKGKKGRNRKKTRQGAGKSPAYNQTSDKAPKSKSENNPTAPQRKDPAYNGKKAAPAPVKTEHAPSKKEIAATSGGKAHSGKPTAEKTVRSTQNKTASSGNITFVKIKEKVKLFTLTASAKIKTAVKATWTKIAAVGTVASTRTKETVGNASEKMNSYKRQKSKNKEELEKEKLENIADEIIAAEPGQIQKEKAPDPIDIEILTRTGSIKPVIQDEPGKKLPDGNESEAPGLRDIPVSEILHEGIPVERIDVPQKDTTVFFEPSEDKKKISSEANGLADGSAHHREQKKKEHGFEEVRSLEELGEDDQQEKNTGRVKIIKKRRERQVGCLGGVLYFLFIACISVILGSLAWMFATDMLGMGTGTGETISVTIPEDFTIDSVTDLLCEKNIVSYRILFKFYAKLSKAETKIQAGTYDLNTESDYRALVNEMRGKSATKQAIKVTLPEGYTMKQMFEELETNGVCTAEKLWRAAREYDFNYDFLDHDDIGNPYRLEGYLFPDTYNFYTESTPETTISKLLDNFAIKWRTGKYTARANELGYSMKQILIVASIAEKEVGSAVEMGQVTSVIYNRLRAGMRLQMNSTIDYVIANEGGKFSTDLDSPYNTYKHDGLPVGAISNPGLDAINAALYPEATNYYYFALAKDGTTRFFSDSGSFQAFVNSPDYAEHEG